MILSPDGASGGAIDPAGCAELLEELTARVRATQVRAARAANTEVLALYWSIGRDVLARQDQGGWGAKVVERLANDLRAAFPDQGGWSRCNLQYVRAMAAAWPVASVEEFVQQPAARLPWGHVTVLLARLDDAMTRDWYAARALEHGWSRAVMEHQVMGALHARAGAAPSNFTAHLPARRLRARPADHPRPSPLRPPRPDRARQREEGSALALQD